MTTEYAKAGPHVWYACDRVFDEGGVEVCCLWNGTQMHEAFTSSGDDEVRCARHGLFIGKHRGVRAADSEDAREKLRHM